MQKTSWERIVFHTTRNPVDKEMVKCVDCKFHDLIYLFNVLFMHDFFHNSLPSVFDDFFSKLTKYMVSSSVLVKDILKGRL